MGLEIWPRPRPNRRKRRKPWLPSLWKRDSDASQKFGQRPVANPSETQNDPAEFWNKQHFESAYLRGEWSFHPAAKDRLHALLGFSSREEWFASKYLAGRRGLRALGVGVGTANAELRLLTTGMIDRYDLYDFSEAALMQAKRDAESLGVGDKATYNCRDIHSCELEPGSYDLITFIHSLHHIEDLRGVLKICERALAPSGLFWAVEYIGPDYFDYPPEHTAFARSFYRSLHPTLKNWRHEELTLPGIEEVMRNDPTEAVHSSEIPAALSETFGPVEFIPTYGTFTSILMWSLNHDVLYDTAMGREFMKLVLEMDTALIDSGKLPHYFGYYVASK